MRREPVENSSQPTPTSLASRLRQRGVLRVALSYAVIAWLTLQIGDVVLEPMGAPGWVMRALIVLVVAGFPIALLLAWYFELTPTGIERDTRPADVERPSVGGVRRYADVAVIGILLVTVIVLLAREGGLLQESAGPPVIGVLPFTELGVPEEEAYFGAGLADTLTYKLGHLKQLMVLAPSSTREFRGSDQDLRLIGAKLAATVLLEGTVRRASGMLRVNARLVDVASGQQLWSGSYDRAGADLFAVQDEIATAVTEALQLVLSPEETTRLTHAQTTELNAYEAYLLGQARMASRNRVEMADAVRYFRQATELDPAYALAHAALAEALYLATTYSRGLDQWKDIADEARSAAAQAQALDPSLGEGYLAQALTAVADNDFGDGTAWPPEYVTALLKKAVELSPNSATALKFYSNQLNSVEERLQVLQRAAQLDPRSGVIRDNIASNYEDLGDYEQALEWYLRAALSTDPTFNVAYHSISMMHWYSAGRVDEAARWARAFYSTYPGDARALLSYSLTLTGLGAWKQAEDLLDNAYATSDQTDPELYLRAFLVSQVGLSMALGDCDRVAEYTRQYAQNFLPAENPWHDLKGQQFFTPRVVVPLTLCDIRAGQTDAALQRLIAAFPDPTLSALDNLSSWGIRAPELLAALYKESGDPAKAGEVLAAYLSLVEKNAVLGEGGRGFARFIALSLLGQNEQAIAEFRAIVELGWTDGWWVLDYLSFDPEFATIWADPRMKVLRQELVDRIDRQRESFLGQPELPDEMLQRSGLRRGLPSNL